MQLRAAFVLIVLSGTVGTMPVSDNNSTKLIITHDLYPEQYVVYSSQYEIINLIVPLNHLNYGDHPGSSYLFFFIEVDKDESGKRIEKGLYVYKNGRAKKLLDRGRDVATAIDRSKDAFIAAEDGIYLYNDDSVSVEKYTSISDSIIGIAKPSESDIIYILTEDKEVYAVSEGDEKKERVSEIVDAEQIVLDYDNNLYYLDADTQVYIYDFLSVTKVKGIPEYAISAQLLKPPVTAEGFVPFVVDGKLYSISPNGKAEMFDKIEFAHDGTPSAYAMEDGVVHYYAKDKKIYEFDIYDILHNGAKGLLGKIIDKSLGEELLALLGLLV